MNGRRFLLTFSIAVGALTGGVLGACSLVASSTLEVFPAHFRLRTGERIHYTLMRRSAGAFEFVDEFSFESGDPRVVRVVDPRGVLEAASAGRTNVVVRSGRDERRLAIAVEAVEVRPISAVPHEKVARLAGDELLFVGHANLDGFDHTAVAKAGIDRLVHAFKTRGQPVVYFVSEEYPYWYTEDRQPDVAVISEGQEHEIAVDADRVVFSGGGFMFCLVRNAQMTLHGMLQQEGRNRVHFVFPADAIWIGDLWGPGRPRPYPAPMRLLSDLLRERATAPAMYDDLIIPFLDRLLNEFPVADYPPTPPDPHLDELLDGWNVEVTLDDVFIRHHRRTDSPRVIRLDFYTESPAT